MLSLVERLLDPNFYRYQPKAILQTHDLRSIITASVERTNPLAQTKEIGFNLNLPSEPARAFTDSNFLDQVLDNLIYNAIQYSPPHSTITINLQARDNLWHAEVQDQGPGISDEDRASLFTEPRAKKRTSDAIDENRHSSRGFGLFIVDRIMHELGGTVSYRKVVDGSIFLLTMPIAAEKWQKSKVLRPVYKSVAERLKALVFSGHAAGTYDEEISLTRVA